MKRCEVTFETLSAYVDGELDAHRELEVRRHLDGCERCREAVDALLGLKDAVASAAEIRPVPHGLRERLSEVTPSNLAPRSRTAVWMAVTAAAVMLAAIGVGRWVVRANRSVVDGLTEALVEDHIRYLELPDAIQIASDDPRRIADSFNSRVGFPIRLPQLNNANLLGARFCWLEGHKAVLSFYESGGKRFSLFVLDREALPGAELRKDRCRLLGKYQVCLVPDAPELLALVADRQQARTIIPQLEKFQMQHQQP